MTASKIPLIVTIPHSGEKVPAQAPWLNQLPEEILMCDVDRYVDFLYGPTLKRLHIPFVKTEWHRYAADLNRIPDDVDASSVSGHKNPAGMHGRGFHWVNTTHKQILMTEPLSLQAHKELVELVYNPFHEGIRHLYQSLHEQGYTKTYHLDAHSMPSRGTSEHRDPGEMRADIVVSDCKGTSCDARFKDLVIAAYATAGFKVAYNWPYFGGRVTEQYGKPDRQQHAIQVEINRAKYMNETTKRLNSEDAKKTQELLALAMEYICNNLMHIV